MNCPQCKAPRLTTTTIVHATPDPKAPTLVASSYECGAVRIEGGDVEEVKACPAK